MSEQNSYGQATDWVLGALRRNPEAVLVLAAGCALLMRGKGGSGQASRHEPRREPHDYYRDAVRPSGVTDRARDTMAHAAQSAQSYASNASNSVGDTARGYAADVSDAVRDGAAKVSGYASDVRDSMARFPDQARSTVESGFARVLRDQPLAIAAAGLAAGATLAALFPATDTENQMLGSAHDAMVDAASRTAQHVKAAAGQAGEQLKQAAQDRGLSSESLKNLARDVAGTFTDTVTGGDKQTNRDSQSAAPKLVPEHTGTGA